MASSDAQSPAAGRRDRISDESLHISAFAIIGDGKGSILLLKAGDRHPLSFRRGKLLLPAAMLNFGERPFAAVKRVVQAQLVGGGALEPKFRQLQSYLGSHWDLCIVYDFEAGTEAAQLRANDPFVGAAFYSLGSLPRDLIASDHLEVIDGLSRDGTC
jgi:hypothetical protein